MEEMAEPLLAPGSCDANVAMIPSWRSLKDKGCPEDGPYLDKPTVRALMGGNLEAAGKAGGF